MWLTVIKKRVCKTVLPPRSGSEAILKVWPLNSRALHSLQTSANIKKSSPLMRKKIIYACFQNLKELFICWWQKWVQRAYQNCSSIQLLCGSWLSLQSCHGYIQCSFWNAVLTSKLYFKNKPILPPCTNSLCFTEILHNKNYTGIGQVRLCWTVHSHKTL